MRIFRKTFHRLRSIAAAVVADVSRKPWWRLRRIVDGDDCLIASGCVFVDHSHEIEAGTLIGPQRVSHMPSDAEQIVVRSDRSDRSDRFDWPAFLRGLSVFAVVLFHVRVTMWVGLRATLRTIVAEVAVG